MNRFFKQVPRGKTSNLENTASSVVALYQNDLKIISVSDPKDAQHTKEQDDEDGFEEGIRHGLSASDENENGATQNDDESKS